MAQRSGHIETTVAGGFRLRLEWSLRSQSISNNTSTVDLVLRWIAQSGWHVVAGTSLPGVVTANGRATDFRNHATLSRGGSREIWSGSRTISHQANGAATFSASAWWDFNGVLNGVTVNRMTVPSRNFTLPQIARASTINANPNFTAVTSQLNVGITRHNTGFSHSARLSMRNAAGSWVNIGGWRHFTGVSLRIAPSQAEITTILNALGSAASRETRVELITRNGGNSTSPQLGSTAVRNGRITAPGVSRIAIDPNFTVLMTRMNVAIVRYSPSFSHSARLSMQNAAGQWVQVGGWRHFTGATLTITPTEAELGLIFNALGGAGSRETRLELITRSGSHSTSGQIGATAVRTGTVTAPPSTGIGVEPSFVFLNNHTVNVLRLHASLMHHVTLQVQNADESWRTIRTISMSNSNSVNFAFSALENDEMARALNGRERARSRIQLQTVFNGINVRGVVTREGHIVAPAASSISANPSFTFLNSHLVHITRGHSSLTHRVDFEIQNPDGQTWRAIRSDVISGVSLVYGFNEAQNRTIAEVLNGREQASSRVRIQAQVRGINVRTAISRSGTITASPATTARHGHFALEHEDDSRILNLDLTRANTALTHDVVLRSGNEVIQEFSGMTGANIELSSANLNRIRDLVTSGVTLNNLNLHVTTRFAGVLIRSATTSANFTVTLNDAMPLLRSDNPTWQDLNADVIAVTGNNQWIVQGRSNVRVTIPANFASGRHNKAIREYEVSLGESFERVPFSTEAIPVNLGEVDISGPSALVIRARDQRDNVSLRTLTVQGVEYAQPTLEVSAIRNNGFSNPSTLTLRGAISPIMIDDIMQNAVHATNGVRYRHRIASRSWSGWINWPRVTSGAGDVTTEPIGISLDNLYEHEIEFAIEDRLATTTDTVFVPVGQPTVFMDPIHNAVSVNGLPTGDDQFDVHGVQVINTRVTNNSGGLRVRGATGIEGRLWSGTGGFGVTAMGNASLHLQTNGADRVVIAGNGATTFNNPTTHNGPLTANVAGAHYTRRVHSGGSWRGSGFDSASGDARALIRQVIRWASSEWNPIVSASIQGTASGNSTWNGAWSSGILRESGAHFTHVFHDPNGTNRIWRFNQDGVTDFPGATRIRGNITADGNFIRGHAQFRQDGIGSWANANFHIMHNGTWRLAATGAGATVNGALGVSGGATVGGNLSASTVNVADTLITRNLTVNNSMNAASIFAPTISAHNFVGTLSAADLVGTINAARIPALPIVGHTSGTLTVARGGTGATTAAAARNNIGLTNNAAGRQAIGAHNAGNLTEGTLAAARLPAALGTRTTATFTGTVSFQGNLNSPGSANRNITGATNARIGITSPHGIGIASSSARFKLMIDKPDMEELADKILDLKISSWFDKNSCEELAEYLTRKNNGEDVKVQDFFIEPLVRIFGLISEEVDDLGLGMFVDKNEKGEIFGVQYERIWILLIPLFKKQRDKITELEKKVENLEERIMKLEKLIG